MSVPGDHDERREVGEPALVVERAARVEERGREDEQPAGERARIARDLGPQEQRSAADSDEEPEQPQPADPLAWRVADGEQRDHDRD
jgi:hypothetical protein